MFCAGAIRSQTAGRGPACSSLRAARRGRAQADATSRSRLDDTADRAAWAAAYRAPQRPAPCSRVYRRRERPGRSNHPVGRGSPPGRCGRSRPNATGPMRQWRPPSSHQWVPGSAPSMRSAESEHTPAAAAASKPTKSTLGLSRSSGRKSRSQRHDRAHFIGDSLATKRQVRSRPAWNAPSGPIAIRHVNTTHRKLCLHLQEDAEVLNRFAKCVKFEQSLPKRVTKAQRSSTNLGSG